MNAVLEHVLRVNLIWSAALVCVALAMTWLRVRDPRTRYHVMWSVYVLVLPASVISVFYRPVVTVASMVPVVAGPNVAATAHVALDVVAAVFVAAMVAGLLHFARRWYDLTRRSKRLNPCADPRVGMVVEQLKSGLGVRTGVQCYETDAMASPCSLGLWRPSIVLSRDILTRSKHETLVHVVAHELAHIRNHDYARNLAQKLVRAVFFFNPIAHLFDARLEDARELACDRRVIEEAGVDRRAYAQTLLEMGLRLREQWAGSPSIALLKHRSQLMRRISCMRANLTPDRRIKTAILSTLVVVAFAIIACSNSEEVSGPVSDAGTANATVAREPNAVFIDEAGNRTLVELAEDGHWSPSPDADPAEVAEFKQQLQLLHESGDVSFDGNRPHQEFIDENGKRALVELQAQWTAQQGLHEEGSDGN